MTRTAASGLLLWTIIAAAGCRAPRAAPPRHTVVGRILDATGTRPEPGAEVRFHSAGISVYSDGNGGFHADIPDGEPTSILVRKDGRLDALLPAVRVTRGMPLELEVWLDPFDSTLSLWQRPVVIDGVPQSGIGDADRVRVTRIQSLSGVEIARLDNRYRVGITRITTDGSGIVSGPRAMYARRHVHIAGAIVDARGNSGHAPTVDSADTELAGGKIVTHGFNPDRLEGSINAWRGFSALVAGSGDHPVSVEAIAPGYSPSSLTVTSNACGRDTTILHAFVLVPVGDSITRRIMDAERRPTARRVFVRAKLIGDRGQAIRGRIAQRDGDRRVVATDERGVVNATFTLPPRADALWLRVSAPPPYDRVDVLYPLTMLVRDTIDVTVRLQSGLSLAADYTESVGEDPTIIRITSRCGASQGRRDARVRTGPQSSCRPIPYAGGTASSSSDTRKRCS